MRIKWCLFNAISIVMFLVVACTPAAPTASSQLESISQISIAKTNAREGVLIVKTYVTDEDSWEYTESRRLYGEAQAAFSGWIDQLKADMTFNIDPDNTKYDTMLADAIQKTTDFLNHVEQVEQANASIGSGSSSNQERSVTERDNVSAALIASITGKIVQEVVLTAGMELWREHQTLQSEEKDKNIASLDMFKWESFEAIR